MLVTLLLRKRVRLLYPAQPLWLAPYMNPLQRRKPWPYVVTCRADE